MIKKFVEAHILGDRIKRGEYGHTAKIPPSPHGIVSGAKGTDDRADLGIFRLARTYRNIP